MKVKTRILFEDGTDCELEVDGQHPLAQGAVWSAHMSVRAEKTLPTFTVVGVYVAPDEARTLDIGERFADYVKAASWQDAEEQVLAERGVDKIVIAATFEGEKHCADWQ